MALIVFFIFEYDGLGGVVESGTGRSLDEWGPGRLDHFAVIDDLVDKCFPLARRRV